MTLEPRDYLRSPKIIKRLLTVGALTTWIGSTLVVKLCFGGSWEVSLLAGSLVIVTGPTVIIPMLRRLRLQARIASILHWEGVLIDAIGVFLAVLCFELVVVQHPVGALLGFGERLVAGAIIGIGGGWLLQKLLRGGWIPDSMVNSFVLASAVGLFALAEAWIHEAGLLAATLAGVLIARRPSADVRQLRTFKAELSDLLIGTLFMLLVSRLDLRIFANEGWRLVAAVVLVMVVVRSLNIWASAVGSGLSIREKLFLSWISPRGIVAASMASLFAIQLGGNARFADEAALLEAVICSTVVIQGLTAGPPCQPAGTTPPTSRRLAYRRGQPRRPRPCPSLDKTWRGSDAG